VPRERHHPDGRDVLRSHRLRRLVDRTDIVLAGGEHAHLHRPRELLVLRDDLAQLRGPLGELGGTERELPPRLEERLARFELDRGAGGDELSRELRRLRGGERDVPFRLAPNHVLSGVPFVQGGPACFAEAADEALEFADGEGEGIRVAVIDTGFTPRLHDWLDTRTNAAPDTLEEQDVQPRNGWLDDEAGHGTFIAGVVLQRAPSATIEIAKVLDTEGYGSELDVARAIVDHADADVINLSLGCYSFDDQPPLALAEALRHVAPTSVVVAAAGNDSTHRPHWPAAHKRAIGVAALDDVGERASFSNYGWWVDAAARGVGVVSTFLEFAERDDVAIPGRTPQRFERWARWSGTSFAAPRLAGEIAAAMTRDGHTSARAAAAALLAGGGHDRAGEVGVVLGF
jgi:subtilisin family serine protease